MRRTFQVWEIITVLSFLHTFALEFLYLNTAHCEKRRCYHIHRGFQTFTVISLTAQSVFGELALLSSSDLI